MLSALLVKRSCPEFIYPFNNWDSRYLAAGGAVNAFAPNAGIAVTSPVTPDTWSAWTSQTSATTQMQILLQEPVVLISANIHEMFSTPAANALSHWKMEIAYGIATADHLIAKIGGAIGFASSGAVETKTIIKAGQYWFNPVKVPAGNRIWVRVTSTMASLPAFTATFMGYRERHWPLVKNLPSVMAIMEGRAGEVPLGKTWPEVGTLTMSATAPAGLLSNLVQVIPPGSLTKAALVWGMTTGDIISNSQPLYEFYIGQGGDPVMCLPGVGRGSTIGPGFGAVYAPRPLLVLPNESLYIGMRGTGGGNAFAVLGGEY